MTQPSHEKELEKDEFLELPLYNGRISRWLCSHKERKDNSWKIGKLRGQTKMNFSQKKKKMKNTEDKQCDPTSLRK